jgi:hypothetical protein
LNARRLLNLAAAFAAVAAAAVACVIAAAFAVYATARVWLGPAGGAAVTAAVFAVVAVGIAVLATRKVAPEQAAEDVSLVDRLMQMAKERPLIAAGAAAAILTIVVRNPGVLTAVLSAFLAGQAAKPDGK